MAETTIIPPWHTPRKPGIYAPEYRGVKREQVSPLVYVEVLHEAPAHPPRKALLVLFARVFLGVFGGLLGFFVAALLLAWAFVR